jgi:hypothetical protein
VIVAMPLQFGNTSIACSGRGCTFSTHQTDAQGHPMIMDTAMSWLDLVIRIAIMAVIMGIVVLISRMIVKRLSRR